MSKLIFAPVLTTILLVEFFVAAKPLMTGNPARVPYRQKELHAALDALTTNRNPETEAAFRNEMTLISRYETKQKLPACAITFVGFLLLDAVCVYLYRGAGHEKETVT
jgi:hypothetical protein